MAETNPHDPGPELANERAEAHATAAREPLRIGDATVRIGTASWTDPTMTAPGVFYPPDATSAEDRLVYYANQFPIVEVDSTYYALPARRTGELWLERTPPDFIFDIKAHALMTGQPSEVSRLPKDLRESLPAEIVAKKRVYARDLSREIEDEIWGRFMDGIEPLRSSGKLGAVFLQYPRWFFPTSESRDEILAARERLGDTPFAVAAPRLVVQREEPRPDARLPREARDSVRDGRRATRHEVVAAADHRDHLTAPRRRSIPWAAHRDLGAERDPGRGALPVPVRRAAARRVGAAYFARRR